MKIYGKLLNKGFALIEVLIALSIITIVILGIYTGVSGSVLAISQSKEITNAVIIAKSKLNEFKADNMRGTDLNDQEIEDFPGYVFDRNIERYETEFFPDIPANIVKIRVRWNMDSTEKSFELSYIYATN
ncbi:MAG: prepilin-type N-terminal cleavage/methylation domain-containing protein [Spirochaetes bacterium]|nr:prepilin-type N-terminal cleavage/methylation domain-containing protein [Spirochaetota bacterium]